MASGAPPSVASTKETTNYARLCRVLVDVGSQALRTTFDGIHPPAGLHGVLARHPEHTTLQSLRRKKILNPTQWGKVYPTVASSVSSASFDITLLMVLLRNICGLHPPATGWDSLPPPADSSKEANIVRVKYYRNTVYGHASQASVDDATFNTYWQDINTALVALGGVSYGAAINKLKNECMDPDMEEHYRELLKQWKKDEDSIKDKLEEIEEALKQLKEGKGDINDELGEVEGNIKDKLDQVENQVSQEAENVKEKLNEMGNQVKNVNEKLDSLTRDKGSREDEDKIRNDLEQMKSEIRSLNDKLDTLMTQRGDEGQVRDDFQQMRNELQNITEKMNSHIRPRKVAMDEDDFVQAEIIDGIRQLYKSREGWLAPFPWCEEFHFHLDDIYTRLKVVSRKKTRGTTTTDTVNMSGIFRPHQECPRTVLIEGKPGMGKTTYSKKLVYDWATKKPPAEDCIPRFETVLLLRCRDMKSDLWEAIDDQLLPLDIKEDERERFFDFIRHNQSDVLLILDGLDEAPAKKLPMFSEIIQGRVLPKCKLVATARHEAGIKVRIYCDTLLEIEGFTEEDVKKFIFKFFKTNENLAQTLLSRLRIDNRLLQMAANPLNAALLCLLCEEFKGVFPKYRAELYMDIVQCVLRRYIQKKGLPENEDLIEAYKPQLKLLGRIALKGLQEDNLDFEEREFGNHLADLPGFGFLSVQQGGSKLRPGRRYAFLHKSFQEWFAAFYLCCQFENESTPDNLAKNFHGLWEALVTTFILLMVRSQNPESYLEAFVKSMMTQVNNCPENRDGDDFCFCIVLNCIILFGKEKDGFDIELARIAGSSLKRPDYTIWIRNDTHAVIDFEALKANSSATCLHLVHSNFGEHGFTALIGALKERKSLTKVSLFNTHIGDHGASCLAGALREMKSLTKLYMSYCDIGDAGVSSLAGPLRENESLTELDLSDNLIGVQGATRVAEILRWNKRMTWLCYSGNESGDCGASDLASALREHKSLAKLYLSRSNIGDDGAMSLAAALKENKSLKELYLPFNNIGDRGAADLAGALRVNTSLTMLNLHGNKISAAFALDMRDHDKRANFEMLTTEPTNSKTHRGRAKQQNRETEQQLYTPIAFP